MRTIRIACLFLWEARSCLHMLTFCVVMYIVYFKVSMSVVMCLECETKTPTKRIRASDNSVSPDAKRMRTADASLDVRDAALSDLWRVSISPLCTNTATHTVETECIGSGCNKDTPLVHTTESINSIAVCKEFGCASLNLKRSKANCPLPGCCKAYKGIKDMYVHFRKCHTELVNEKGGCIEFGVPDIVTKDKSISIPRELSCDYNISISQYAFLKKMVDRNLIHDYAKYKHNRVATTGRYETYGEETFLKKNAEKHRIVQSIMYYIIDLGLLEKNAIDEAGGCVERGLSMEIHSGVFGLSLDRKDHTQPHFPNPESPLANIRVIAIGLNTHVNIVARCGVNSCSYIRREMQRELSGDEIDRTCMRESLKTTRHGRHTTSYECCKSIFYEKSRGVYKDMKCRNQFLTIDTFWKYAIDLWYSQNMRCAVSDILLQGADAQEPFFKMSLDSIDPRVGHVKGNLRWICQGLNSTNMVKLMKNNQEYDHDTNAWTRQNFRAYVGLP